MQSKNFTYDFDGTIMVTQKVKTDKLPHQLYPTRFDAELPPQNEIQEDTIHKFIQNPRMTE